MLDGISQETLVISSYRDSKGKASLQEKQLSCLPLGLENSKTVLSTEQGRPYEQTSKTISFGRNFFRNRVWGSSGLRLLLKMMSMLVISN